MNGVHKFQVDAIKTSKIRIFIDNQILLKVWLSSSTETWAFLTYTRLVVIFSLHYIKPLTFFAQIVISDDAAELPLAMKWVSVVVTACRYWSVHRQFYQLNLTLSACIAVELPACFTICAGIGDAVEKT